MDPITQEEPEEPIFRLVKNGVITDFSAVPLASYFRASGKFLNPLDNTLMTNDQVAEIGRLAHDDTLFASMKTLQKERHEERERAATAEFLQAEVFMVLEQMIGIANTHLNRPQFITVSVLMQCGVALHMKLDAVMRLAPEAAEATCREALASPLLAQVPPVYRQIIEAAVVTFSASNVRHETIEAFEFVMRSIMAGPPHDDDDDDDVIPDYA